MTQFSFHRASTIEEAVGLLARDNVMALAGGTDLVIALRERTIEPAALVDVRGIAGLRQVSREGGRVRVGAAVTFSELAGHPLFAGPMAAIAEAAGLVGSPQIRNAGTLGGNIANGSPAADAVVPFVALDAVVALASTGGVRMVALADVFAAAPGAVNIGKGELITELAFQMPSKGTRSAFVKLGRRNALSIARLSCAAFLRTDESGVLRDVRVAVGAAAPHPFRMMAVESLLEGRPATAATVEGALAAASDDIVRVLGSRASMPYKREAIKGVLWEAVDLCAGQQP